MNEFVQEHDVSLSAGRVRLRPLREDDLDAIVRWNADVEVLYWYDGSKSPHDAEETRQHWRESSHNGYTWIIEYDSKPIGECRLYHQMPPVESVQQRCSGQDVRTIELMIGEKEYWGRGVGTAAIRLVTELAFAAEQADVVCTFDVQGKNRRSLRAFRRVGFQTVDSYAGGDETCYALALTKAEYALSEVAETCNT